MLLKCFDLSKVLRVLDGFGSVKYFFHIKSVEAFKFFVPFFHFKLNQQNKTVNNIHSEKFYFLFFRNIEVVLL